MDDITILYITANEMSEHWMKFQIYHLLKAAQNSPIISISRKPMDLGMNLIDSEPKSYWNIYMQMLRGALIAKTPYVALAEDDVLYTESHFNEFRPPPDKVSYDRSRWSLFTWEKEPIYCLRQRISNCSLIAPRELLIEALTERKEKWPDNPPESIFVGEVGRSKVDRWLKVTPRGCVEWYSFGPIVQLNHPQGTDGTQKRHWKRHGQIRAYDIPYWGKAKDIVKEFYGTGENRTDNGSVDST
jgi:hypothetical protein